MKFENDYQLRRYYDDMGYNGRSRIHVWNRINYISRLIKPNAVPFKLLSSDIKFKLIDLILKLYSCMTGMSLDTIIECLLMVSNDVGFTYAELANVDINFLKREISKAV